MSSPVKRFCARNTLFFSGNVASGVADVESLFLHFRGSAPQCGKTVDKKGTGLCRKLDLHSYFKMLKKLAAAEHFWEMRSAKCARDCSESSVS